MWCLMLVVVITGFMGSAVAFMVNLFRMIASGVADVVALLDLLMDALVS